MCQMDAHMETTPQQMLLNSEKKASANGDNGFVARLPAKVEKFPTATSPNDCGKKKRRAAKLKQCKMDARREQWLAQVTSVSGKGSKPDSCASSHSSSQDDREDKELYLQASPGDLIVGTPKKDRREDLHSKQTAIIADNREMWSEGHFLTDIHSGELLVDGTRQSPLCCSQSPMSPNSGQVKDRDDKEAECKSGEARRLDGFTNAWSTSDTSSSQSNSSQVSSSSDDENDVEDWEAVADALHVQVSVVDVKQTRPEAQYMAQNRTLAQTSISLSSSDVAKCILKPESKYRPGNCGSRTRADVGRAWRPDDVFRPPTLPRLSKQHSFPLQSGPSLWSASHANVWGLPPPAPSHCPICTEELDPTDSSFLPCSCGFRLCLFCHNRILVGDGRCPGCRKSYNTEVAAKLSRTASVRPRV